MRKCFFLNLILLGCFAGGCKPNKSMPSRDYNKMLLALNEVTSRHRDLMEKWPNKEINLKYISSYTLQYVEDYRGKGGKRPIIIDEEHDPIVFMSTEGAFRVPKEFFFEAVRKLEKGDLKGLQDFQIEPR